MSVVDILYLSTYMKHHGLYANGVIVFQNKLHLIKTDANFELNGFYCVYEFNEFMMFEGFWVYLSSDLSECFDYCNIPYYRGVSYR